MKNTIERLSSGKIEYSLPELGVSVSQIHVKLEAGCQAQGSFDVFSKNDRELKGVIFSTSVFVRPDEDQFVGKKTTIRYTVQGENFAAGEELSGYFHIVSNGGEFSVPFSVQVEQRCYHSGIGKVRSFETFVALAKRNFDESVKLFLYPDFADVVLGEDFAKRALYKGLKEGVNPDLALEEFLVTTRAKERVSLTLENTEQFYGDVTGNIRDCLVLVRNTWGYAEAEAEVEGDFLLECRARFTTEDFTGHRFEYRYCIDKKKLRRGKNLARITFKVGGQILSATITVIYMPEDCREEVGHRQMISRLMDGYLKFRMQQYNYEKWTNDSIELLDRLKRNDDSDLMIRLMKAQMCIIKGKKEEAAYILDYVQGQLPTQKHHSVEMQCYYDYIRTLQYRRSDFTKNVAQKIGRIYDGGHKSWQLLWILLFVDERYETNRSRKLAAIKECCHLGQTSPVLYYEALSVLNEQPEFLRILDPFEIRTLLMGAKRRYVNLKLALEAAGLAKKEREFRPLVFELLHRLYDQYPNNAILEAICTVLIHGGQTDRKYFKWFELAVKNDLKIPKLYEYYLFSVDMTKMDLLPQMVYLYFAYNTETVHERESYLFANVITNKDKIPEIYESYRKTIEQYSVHQMLVGAMDEYLGVIYGSVLSRALVTEDIARRLPAMLAGCKITLEYPKTRGGRHAHGGGVGANAGNRPGAEDPNLRRNPFNRVIVIPEETGVENIYPMTGGQAYVRIYSSNAAILFQDIYGNRYSGGVRYRITKLMDLEYYMRLCQEVHPDNPDLRLHFGDAVKKEFSAAGRADREKAQNRKGRNVYGVAGTGEGREDRLQSGQTTGENAGVRGGESYRVESRSSVFENQGGGAAPGSAQGRKRKKNRLPELIKPVLELENLDPAYRAWLVKLLVEYYYTEMDDEAIRALTEVCDPGRLDRQTRGKYLELMILNRMYQEVYPLLKKYGARQVSPGLLSRFLARILPDRMDCEDAAVTEMCGITFQKRVYDDAVLKYMSRFYNGSIRELLVLWTTSKQFAFYSLELEERIIVQALFCGISEPMVKEVFRKYYCYGFRQTVMSAYINQMSFNYIVKDNYQDDNLIKYLKNELLHGEPVHVYGKLAYLRYYSDRRAEIQPKSDEEAAAVRALKDLIGRGIYMEYFRAFADIAEIPANYLERYYLTFRYDPKATLSLSYRVRTEEVYRREPFGQMVPGVFSMPFRLFGDDVLEYRIYLQEAKGEVLLKEGICRGRSGERRANEGCFERIEEIVEAGGTPQLAGQLSDDYEEKKELARRLL
ncbi:MAG: DUF5717 family protein [Lachnospiraceae bacterium]|nr:DUF5717 family protein [Lachnospiraceae bacterium]